MIMNNFAGKSLNRIYENYLQKPDYVPGDAADRAVSLGTGNNE